MTEHHDPYAVLGVAPVATPAEINHAFRVKVRDLHPDTRHALVGGAAGDNRLEQLIAAYHLLRDPERRALYDRSVSLNPDVPLTIPVTRHRSQPPTASQTIWAGPVRRHR
jgi:curved DNA-binding protein CbpA